MPYIDVNGKTIDYPDTGDPNWGDNATNFAIETSAALGKIGLSSGTSVDIPQTLDVTGNTTLDANLTVNGNTTLGNASGDSLTINSNGVSIPNGLNFDSNTLVIDATNNRVGIGVLSPAYRLNIGGETAQFPTSVSINETGHASSKRAGILIGSWLQMQDSQGNGTRDLSFYYTQGTPYTAFNISTNGQLNAVIPGSTTLYPGFLCRAWVNFNGQTNNNLSGTYSQSGTTVTVTATSHGYIVGNQVSIDITTGTAVDGGYLVTEVIDSNNFRYTAGTSLTTSGNCTLLRNTIRASGNVSSISDQGTGDYTVNFTTPMPDVNYAILSSSEQSAGNSPVNINRNNSRTDTAFRTNICTTQGSTFVDIPWVSIGIFR